MKYEIPTGDRTPEQDPDYFVGWTGMCTACGTRVEVEPGDGVIKPDPALPEFPIGTVIRSSFIAHPITAHVVCKTCDEQSGSFSPWIEIRPPADGPEAIIESITETIVRRSSPPDGDATR